MRKSPAAKKPPKKRVFTKKQKEAMEELEGAFFQTANELGHEVPSEARDLLEIVAEMIVVAAE